MSTRHVKKLHGAPNQSDGDGPYFTHSFQGFFGWGYYLTYSFGWRSEKLHESNRGATHQGLDQSSGPLIEKSQRWHAGETPI